MQRTIPKNVWRFLQASNRGSAGVADAPLHFRKQEPAIEAQRISPPHNVLRLNTAGQFRFGGQVICGRCTETAMTTEHARRLDMLSRQLTESLMSAAICAKEIGEIAHAQAEDDDKGKPGANDNGRGRSGSPNEQRPLLDEATLTVTWRGRTLHLGYTQGFRLLTRLARRATQYVTHLDLLREIWDDDFADTTLLRAGMQRLKVKLRRGGMADLADAIVGHRGRYMLDLAAVPRHRKIMPMSHRTSQA